MKAPRRLEKCAQERFDITETQVKVRVTYVSLNLYDSLCYTAEKKVTYPRTIGRNAVGIVKEVGAKCYGLSVGTRVYLNALRPCGKCYACKSGGHSHCTSPLIAVQDFDGFLRDFVVCEYTDVTVIPDNVDDMLALCIESVALAENIFDRLQLPVGSKVAVIGAGLFGSVLAQIAMYHKMVPVVIDTYESNVERLKRSGAFFSFVADDDLIDEIEKATSGTLCDAAVYTSGCKLPASVPARVLARNKTLVLGGFNTINFSLETTPLFDKNLQVLFVSDGYGYLGTAMNMLTHGALDLTNFEKQVFTDFDASAILQDAAKNSAKTAKLNILKLIL